MKSIFNFIQELVQKALDKMNTITVNGVKHQVKGKNIRQVNNKLYVDNEFVTNVSGDVHIIFEGNLASLDCNSCMINGDVGGDIDTNSATVSGNVKGNIDANSVIVKGHVLGKIDALSVTHK